MPIACRINSLSLSVLRAHRLPDKEPVPLRRVSLSVVSLSVVSLSVDGVKALEWRLQPLPFRRSSTYSLSLPVGPSPLSSQ